MFAIQSNIVWFFIFIHVCNCGRRIQGGKLVMAEKPYVVYLVKAPLSKSDYDYWLCGGALVSRDFVVTSAACIKDVDFLYVIAGYNKYVTDQEIDLDPCTSKKKKKVIYTCYPEGYDLRYDRLDKWSLIDIAVAKVESPYDFTDQSYKTLCSYIPGTIPINFEAKYQAAGVDAIVLGWGHRIQWRQPEDTNNYNQERLNFAPVMILDKSECKSHYENHGDMIHVIDSYMICTIDGGHINDYGVPMEADEIGIVKVLPYGCANRRSLTFNPEVALEDCEYDDEDDRTRRGIKKSSNDSVTKITNKNNANETTADTNRTTALNKTNLTNITAWSSKRVSINRFPLTNRTFLTNRTISTQKTFMYDKTHDFNETVRDTRRYGICQNDHGGPLVTWVGTHEVLIGVASVFKVTEDFTCEGPYLYTSTQCNSAFLDCILDIDNFEDLGRRSLHNMTDNISRRSFCRKSPDDKKHPTTERHISWLYHPAGAADHEKHVVIDRNEPGIHKAPVRNDKNINKSGMSNNPENKVIPARARYPPVENSQQFSLNVNNVPNTKYVVNENIALNINQRGAPNNKHVTYNQHPPRDIPRMTNDRYSPYNGPASNSGPTFSNYPTINNEPALNYNPAQIKGDAASNGPELNFKSERVKILATNNRPELNFRSERVKNLALNNNPVINIKSERINNLTPNNGPAQYIGPSQTNGPAQNHGPIQNNGPAQNLEPTHNNGPEQNNGATQNNGPAQNYEPTHNNGPEQNNGATQNNVPAQNYQSEIYSRPKPEGKSIETKKPQIIQNIGAKIMMRPTISPRV